LPSEFSGEVESYLTIDVGALVGAVCFFEQVGNRKQGSGELERVFFVVELKIGTQTLGPESSNVDVGIVIGIYIHQGQVDFVADDIVEQGETKDSAGTG
jgi:hypothetical protein